MSANLGRNKKSHIKDILYMNYRRIPRTLAHRTIRDVDEGCGALASIYLANKFSI